MVVVEEEEGDVDVAVEEVVVEEEEEVVEVVDAVEDVEVRVRLEVTSARTGSIEPCWRVMSAWMADSKSTRHPSNDLLAAYNCPIRGASFVVMTLTLSNAFRLCVCQFEWGRSGGGEEGWGERKRSWIAEF